VKVTVRKTTKKGATIDLDELTGDFTIHKNLTQDVILTTEDKLRLALIEHRDVLSGKREWISAGTLSLSLLSTLLLTNFKDGLGLTADTWRAAYCFFFAMAFLWFVNSLIKLYRNRKRREIDFLIKEIQQRGKPQEAGIRNTNNKASGI
jgi:hypothetical protein